MSEPTYCCSLCGKPFYRDCLTVTYKDAELPKAWEICEECEASLNEWAKSRARVEGKQKICPFSHGKGGTLHVSKYGAIGEVESFGDCTSDCAVYFGGKCALTAIAEAMC